MLKLDRGLCLDQRNRAGCERAQLGGSCCRVLGSCLYKEWPAAGKTRRPGYSWRASVLVGQLTRVNKSRDFAVSLTLKPPGRTGNGWNARPRQWHDGVVKGVFIWAASFNVKSSLSP